jgi:pyrophosphatase PpaX
LAGVGTPLRVQFAPWADRPALFNALIETYRDYNISNHDLMVRAYPGAVEMVREARAAGCRTGLVTSKQRGGAERGLKFLGLEGAMDVVVAADDVTNPKPHPEPVLIALDRLGAPADGAVYVGDSVHDMECGRGAGVATAAVLWGPFTQQDLVATRPDYWLENPGDLRTLFQ